MRRYATAYVSTLVVLVLLDACWLTLMGKSLYRARLSDLMLPQPEMGAAVVFYLLYAAGVVVFAVLPALRIDSLPGALGLGALPASSPTALMI